MSILYNLNSNKMFNKTKILDAINKAAIFTAGGVGYHLIDRALYYKANMIEDKIQKDRAEELQNGIKEVNDGLSGIGQNLNSLSDKINSMREEYISRGPEKFSQIKDKWFEMAQDIKDKCVSVESKLSELSIPDWENSGYSQELKEVMVLIDKFTDYIDDFEKTNKFLPDFSEFYKYLDNISILQESSLFHILLFIVLLLTVFNILSVLFGNEIIKYFNLEERFPRLGLFFRLRIKFQRYYLMWNVLILFFVCIVGIIIDILLFTVG